MHTHYDRLDGVVGLLLIVNHNYANLISFGKISSIENMIPLPHVMAMIPLPYVMATF